MKRMQWILVCGVIISGCSPEPVHPAPLSGIDRVQSGTETTWRDTIKLTVKKRDGTRLEGVKLEQLNLDGTHFTHTADTATISLGTIEDPKASGFFTVRIPNARAVAIASSGLRLTNTESVEVTLSE